MLPLQNSAIRAAASPPLIYVSIQGRGGPPPPPSAMRAHATILSAFLPQQVDSPIQYSDVNPPPIPRLLAFSFQRDVPLLQPLSACALPPTLYVSLHGRGEPPPSTFNHALICSSDFCLASL